MSDRDPGHRTRRSIPRVGRISNRADAERRCSTSSSPAASCRLRGGVPRNEKKDKRSLVEKEIDTGACLIDAYSKGVARAELRQSVGGGRQSTMQESVASAKLLAGFAVHVASLVIIRQREIELRQKKTRKTRIRKR